MSAVSIRDSPIHGKGVFTNRLITKNKLCCYFKGNIGKLSNRYSVFAYEDDEWLNGYDYPELINKFGDSADKYAGSLVNHGVPHNCVVGRDKEQRLTVIVSTEDIPKDTELLLNYLAP